MEGSQGLRTPLTLAVLSLAAEKPRHPYEMKSVIRERKIEQVVKMRGGSLYDAVKRLESAGLVARTGTTRVGARPERTVYTITEHGRRRMTEMLEEFLGEPVNEYPRFVAGLAHIAGVGPRTAVALLRGRADRLEAAAAAAAETLARARADLPRVVLLEDEYVDVVRGAEIDWLRSVADDIERGAVTWPPFSDDHLPEATTGKHREEAT